MQSAKEFATLDFRLDLVFIYLFIYSFSFYLCQNVKVQDVFWKFFDDKLSEEWFVFFVVFATSWFLLSRCYIYLLTKTELSSQHIRLSSFEHCLSIQGNYCWLQVKVPKGTFCEVHSQFRIGIPPDAVWNILIDPGNKRVFKNIQVNNMLLRHSSGSYALHRSYGMGFNLLRSVDMHLHFHQFEGSSSTSECCVTCQRHYYRR